MATQLSTALKRLLPELRFEPTPKRIRARLGEAPVLDSSRAVLVWEPRRVLPSYAVHEADVAASLSPAASPPPAGADPAELPVMFPNIPFAVRLSGGEALDVAAGSRKAPGAAFRLADPDLAGYIVFDFGAFDWLEEEESIASHPRDPFHRVDVRRSDKHVQVSLHGRRLADSHSPMLVFETNVPVRTYLPPEDVNWPELNATDSVTGCAYKGQASYWAMVDGDGRDIAWSYLTPLPDAAQLAGLVCFYDEHTDITVDGDR
ncbi:MAG TPA: DUF427 domain-containing protein [Micrococcaceae bacterium]|jgi:uncharacterized protein (DUF427 family)|nr:DUF427 domain-containing protein [Micrococcaceae bacterium]